MADPTVLLARHGETAWNREGRIQGWAPTALTGRGRQQARRLGTHLATTYDIDRLVASDLTRTRETAALIVEGGVSATPVFDRSWRERDMGVYQGFTREQLNERFPAFAVENGAVALEEPPESGESFAEMYSRIRTTWEELATATTDETVLVVTHGGPITAVLATLKRQDLLTAVTQHSIANCGLTAVDTVTGEILRENEQPFEPVPSG